MQHIASGTGIIHTGYSLSLHQSHCGALRWALPSRVYLRVVLRLLFLGLAGTALLPELLKSVFQLSLLLPHLPQSLSMLSVHRLQLVLQLQLLRRQLPQPGRLAPAHCLQLLHTRT